MKKQLNISFMVVLFAFMINSCNKSKDAIKFFPIKSGDKWGYVDVKGNYVINSQFDDAYNFSDGLALFKSNDGKYGFINEEGNYIINPIYKDAGKFSEGLACVVMENGKPQYINKEGKIVFSVDDAEYCSTFKDGMAQIKVKGKWGYIDKTGKVIINPIYEESKKFCEGLAAVAKKDKKTEEIKWGYIDNTGAVKIKFQFIEDKVNDYCIPGDFQEGLAFVSSDGEKWGCINKEGKYEINPQFEGADFNPYGFKNGVSIIRQGDVYGYIDKKGKYIINPQFKEARMFSLNGLAAVKHSDDKWGFIGKDGKYEINPQFDDVVQGFISDIAFVKSSDKYGIIDSKGLYVINPQFDAVKLYDIGAFFRIKSDYIDYKEISKVLFPKSKDGQYFGYNKNTTMKDIVKEYPETTVDDLTENYLRISEPDLEVHDMINVSQITFGFSEKTYNSVKKYKKVKDYNVYSGRYYYRDVFDKYEYSINMDASLAYVSVAYTLKSEGKGKGKSFAESIKKQAMKIMKVSEIEINNIKNNDTLGIYLLKSNINLIYLTYYQKINEDGDYLYPVISIAVVNNNYKIDFDQLADDLIEGFIDDHEDMESEEVEEEVE